jgi:hypothetical protein
MEEDLAERGSAEAQVTLEVLVVLGFQRGSAGFRVSERLRRFQGFSEAPQVLGFQRGSTGVRVSERLSRV